MAQPATQHQDVFVVEERTFQTKKAELLKRARGQYVLIKRNEVIGIFPTEIAAIEEGTKRYPNQPFYGKQIIEQEEPIVIPSVLSFRCSSRIVPSEKTQYRVGPRYQLSPPPSLRTE